MKRRAEVTLTVVSSLDDFLQIQVRRPSDDAAPGNRRLATIRIARYDVMGLLGGRVTPCEFESEGDS